jgi:hypothetical protein
LHKKSDRGGLALEFVPGRPEFLRNAARPRVNLRKKSEPGGGKKPRNEIGMNAQLVQDELFHHPRMYLSRGLICTSSFSTLDPQTSLLPLPLNINQKSADPR